MMGVIAAASKKIFQVTFEMNDSFVSDGSDINPSGGGGQVKLNAQTNPAIFIDCQLSGGATETQNFLANFSNPPVFTFTGATSNVFGIFINTETLIKLRLQNLGLEQVNLKGAPNLEELYINDNMLTTIDISDNSNISYIIIRDNALNTTSLDNIYISLDNNGVENGTLIIDAGRSSNSDTARNNLITKGWTITEI